MVFSGLKQSYQKIKSSDSQGGGKTLKLSKSSILKAIGTNTSQISTANNSASSSMHVAT